MPTRIEGMPIIDNSSRRAADFEKQSKECSQNSRLSSRGPCSGQIERNPEGIQASPSFGRLFLIFFYHMCFRRGIRVLRSPVHLFAVWAAWRPRGRSLGDLGGVLVMFWICFTSSIMPPKHRKHESILGFLQGFRVMPKDAQNCRASVWNFGRSNNVSFPIMCKR